MASMLSDKVHGESFRQRIEGLDRKRGLFFDDKPLSARQVRRFIDDVTQGASQTDGRISQSLKEDFVAWAAGQFGTITSSESFDSNLNTMLSQKMQGERGIKAGDVDLKGISDEIRQAALNDQEGMAAINSGMQAKAHVGRVMSDVLDHRISNARTRMRSKLRDRLAVSGLPETEKLKVNVEISSSKIATMDELDHYVNQLVIDQIDGEFSALLQQVKEKQACYDDFAQLPDIKKQLKEELAQQKDYRMLSVEVARDKANQILSQWLASKQEALTASQESRYASLANLLIKLTLQEPQMGKAQVASFRDTIEQTLDEVYQEDRSVYEALQIDKKKLFSILHKHDRNSVLFNSLSNLLKQTPKPASVLDSDDWQPPDIKATMRNYIEALSKPMVESYAKVSILKGKVPERIYQTMMEKVGEGYIWDPKFISTANELHISNLTRKDNRGLYDLLDSPQVARKRIGSKEDFVSFTLEDLFQSMLGPKNFSNAKKRRKAIDAVVPKEAQDKLLAELDRQLQQVQSRVMNEEDANALFERGAVRFLRAQRINFEDTVAKK